MAAKRRSSRAQLLPQFEEVINLAIENRDESAARRRHRLMTFLGQIENRKAAVTKRDANLRIDPSSLIVRSAMMERSNHCSNARCWFGESVRAPKARYSAHPSIGLGDSPSMRDRTGALGSPLGRSPTLDRERCSRPLSIPVSGERFLA